MIYPTNSKFQNLLSQRFGRLLVLQYIGIQNHRAMWLCFCSCGKTAKVPTAELKRGRTQSCGCLQRDAATANIRHGYSRAGQRSPEYRAYTDAKARCQNKNNKRYADYGGRGIEFRFTSFEEFLAAVGKRPAADLSIERKNNDGHYEALNLKWAPRSEQQKNKRSYKTRSLQIGEK